MAVLPSPLLLLLLLLFSAVVISFIFLLAKQRNPRRTPRRPPGPNGIQLIGNLFQFDISKPYIWFANLSNKYGPIMLGTVCRLPVVVISSAQVAKAAFEKNDIAFGGRPYSSAWCRLSYNNSDIIGSDYSDYWRLMRKTVVHHLLSPPKIRSFRPIREQEVSAMVAEISNKAASGELIDVEEMALSFTCNLLCRVAFGKKLTDSSKLFDRVVKQFLASVTQTFVIDTLLFGWINKICGANGRVEKVFEEMDAFYQGLIDEHLSPDRPDSMAGDILDLLIRLREDESAPVKIDWKHVKAILMNIFLGGTDSTGATIIWAMTALMKKPSAMKRVQEEIRSVVGMKRSVDEDDIEKLLGGRRSGRGF